MRFEITVKLNDGLAEAPGVEVEVSDGSSPERSLDRLLDEVSDALVNDHGDLLGVGGTVEIVRLA